MKSRKPIPFRKNRVYTETAPEIARSINELGYGFIEDGLKATGFPGSEVATKCMYQLVWEERNPGVPFRGRIHERVNGHDEPLKWMTCATEALRQDLKSGRYPPEDPRELRKYLPMTSSQPTVGWFAADDPTFRELQEVQMKFERSRKGGEIEHHTKRCEDSVSTGMFAHDEAAEIAHFRMIPFFDDGEAEDEGSDE